jgi:hypothetical protein
MPNAVDRALRIAFYCYLAQLFLQSGAIVLVGGLALIALSSAIASGVVMAAVSAAYICFGLFFVKRAARTMTGSGIPPRA